MCGNHFSKTFRILSFWSILILKRRSQKFRFFCLYLKENSSKNITIVARWQHILLSTVEPRTFVKRLFFKYWINQCCLFFKTFILSFSCYLTTASENFPNFQRSSNVWHVSFFCTIKKLPSYSWLWTFWHYFNQLKTKQKYVFIYFSGKSMAQLWDHLFRTLVYVLALLFHMHQKVISCKDKLNT